MSQQRIIVWLAALVQFVNMMDFMMVMPLGPDISRALPIVNSDIGIICGCYTLAIAVSGILFAGILDKFDRKHVAIVAVLGLSVATLATTFCTGLYGLIAARILAGMFGGPAAAIAYTMATEAVPPQQRGKAVAAVMGAFSISSIAAVPFGLELARIGDWKSPFYAITILGVIAVFALFMLMPAMKKHLSAAKQQHGTLRSVLCGRREQIALVMMGSAMISSFLIIPNISAYFQLNRGFPREDLGLLYMLGGGFSLILIQLGGRLSDRIGPLSINLVGTALLAFFLADGFMHENRTPLTLVFVMFTGMVCMRNVSATAEAAKVPGPQNRAAFMSLLSSVQHMGNGIGAIASSAMLGTAKNGELVGMAMVGGISILFALLQPLFMMMLQRGTPKTETATP